MPETPLLIHLYESIYMREAIYARTGQNICAPTTSASGTLGLWGALDISSAPSRWKTGR